MRLLEQAVSVRPRGRGSGSRRVDRSVPAATFGTKCDVASRAADAPRTRQFRNGRPSRDGTAALSTSVPLSISLKPCSKRRVGHEERSRQRSAVAGFEFVPGGGKLARKGVGTIALAGEGQFLLCCGGIVCLRHLQYFTCAAARRAERASALSAPRQARGPASRSCRVPSQVLALVQSSPLGDLRGLARARSRSARTEVGSRARASALSRSCLIACSDACFA